MQTLYDFMRRYRREDGSELCDTFIRAPKRRTDPAYYEVVSDPVRKLERVTVQKESFFVQNEAAF